MEEGAEGAVAAVELPGGAASGEDGGAVIGEVSGGVEPRGGAVSEGGGGEEGDPKLHALHYVSCLLAVNPQLIAIFSEPQI